MTFESDFGDLLTFVALCAQLTRDLLAVAEYLVFVLIQLFCSQLDQNYYVRTVRSTLT